jgi:hypothetical protein
MWSLFDSKGAGALRSFGGRFVEPHGYGEACGAAAGAIGAAATGAGFCGDGSTGFGRHLSTTEQNAASLPASIFPSE